jgi:hypothetical protein
MNRAVIRNPLLKSSFCHPERQFKAPEIGVANEAEADRASAPASSPYRGATAVIGIVRWEPPYRERRRFENPSTGKAALNVNGA